MKEDMEEVCCVCGKPATHYHLSIMGQIRFWVCEKHHKETYPALSSDRMGLMKKGTQNWIKLKHWK
jgi:hypothetical protein